MAKKLEELVRDEIRVRHYSYRTGVTYWKWIKRFILFYDKKHPSEMGEDEIQKFLSYLATERRISASSQNQALSALLFLYKNILKIELPWMDYIVRAKRPIRVPVVLTRTEVASVLKCLNGQYWLMANILYGSGLRLTECLRLRARDIDFEYLQLTIRDGKIKHQLENVRGIFERDVDSGRGGASLPGAIDRKYVNASTNWRWQYLFPSKKYAFIHDHQSMRRHHAHPSGLARALKFAVNEAGIEKRATSHTFRHSFATHLLEGAYDCQLRPV